MISIFRKTFLWLVLLTTCTLLGYSIFFRTPPCDTPIQYRIGTFDTRFNISRADFLSAISEAEKTWDKPFGKTFFHYDNKGALGDLVINLKYDDRQKTTEQNSVLKADVNKTNDLASDIKSQYMTLEAQYSKDSEAYTLAIQNFKRHQEVYKNEVEYWNEKGGVPENQYQKLNADKNNLNKEYSALDKERVALNILVDQINTFISKYNLLVQTNNTTINKINTTAGQEFEEGVFESVPYAITIYEFNDRQKLVRVLAHELGHSLGLDHNKNPKSIMYHLNTSNKMTASKEDISDLTKICSGPSISPLTPWIIKTRLWLSDFMSKFKISI